MEIQLERGEFTAVVDEVLILFHFEQDDRMLGVTATANDASGGMLQRIVESGDFRGEHLEHLLLYSQAALAAERILLMGLGKRQEFTAEKLRETAAQALKVLRDRRRTRAVLPLPLDAAPVLP